MTEIWAKLSEEASRNPATIEKAKKKIGTTRLLLEWYTASAEKRNCRIILPQNRGKKGRAFPAEKNRFPRLPVVPVSKKRPGRTGDTRGRLSFSKPLKRPKKKGRSCDHIASPFSKKGIFGEKGASFHAQKKRGKGNTKTPLFQARAKAAFSVRTEKHLAKQGMVQPTERGGGTRKESARSPRIKTLKIRWPGGAGGGKERPHWLFLAWRGSRGDPHSFRRWAMEGGKGSRLEGLFGKKGTRRPRHLLARRRGERRRETLRRSRKDGAGAFGAPKSEIVILLSPSITTPPLKRRKKKKCRFQLREHSQGKGGGGSFGPLNAHKKKKPFDHHSGHDDGGPLIRRNKILLKNVLIARAGSPKKKKGWQKTGFG